MDYLIIYGASFVAALSGALMPGPVLAVTLAHTSRIGFRAGPLIMVGHALLEAGLFLLLVLGFARFLNQPLVLGGLGLVGGAVLLAMAGAMLRDLKRLGLRLEGAGDGPQEGRAAGPVLAGVLVSLSNPYWTLWWATIGLSYILWSMKAGVAGLAAFLAGHLSADFAWYSLVSYLMWRGGDYLGPAAYRGVVGFCALSLIGLGVYFGVTGLASLV